MYNKRPIAENIYYVGVNDRKNELFEDYLPIPQGITYNSYVIIDEKVAIVDTVDISFAKTFFDKIDALLDGRAVDYLIVNHAEPDHSGAVSLLRHKYPDIQIVVNDKTVDMLKGYFGIDTNIRVVKEGETLNLGKRNLQFYMMPMVHWPEVMATYAVEDKILFSSDAFGSFGCCDGDYLDENIDTDRYWSEMRRYYACIVGKYGASVQKALKKLSGLPIDIICPSHGPVWKDKVQEVIGLVDDWSCYRPTTAGLVIAYGSMYGNTQQMAEAVAEGAIAGGLKNVVIHNVSKTDTSYILSDIFQYSGIVIGSPTYTGQLHPLVEKLVLAIEHRDIKNRFYSCFGSFTWAGTAAKKLEDVAQKMKWQFVGSKVENKHAVSKEKYQKCFELGMQMAEQIL
jgi:flavorubredoxin